MGACSGANFQYALVCAIIGKLRIAYQFLDLFGSAHKFVSLSLQIVVGIHVPLRAINLLKVAIKADVVSSVTGSKCTAFTENDTKTAMYPLMIIVYARTPF